MKPQSSYPRIALSVLVVLAISTCSSMSRTSLFVHALPSSSIRHRTAPLPLFSHSSPVDAVMAVPEPPPQSPAYSLYHLILQNRACRTNTSNGSICSNCKGIPLAGVHDALSAKIFAQNGAPALFLSGFGVSASLLGVPDAGMTNLVEMEMMARNICSLLRSPECHSILVEGHYHPPPLIVDGDTGYGGASNMLRTVSALASAGAAAITIEDQRFPKKCTIAAGSKIQIVDRDECIARVKGALGARDLYTERFQSPILGDSSAGPWIVARTDCRMAYGFQEVIERCLHFEQLGAEIIYAENLQSREEYAQLRDRLDSRTVTMVAQVQETMNARDIHEKHDANCKPLLTVQEIGELGFDLALFGVTPLQCVVGALESAARDFLRGSESEVIAGTGTGTGLVLSGIIGYDEESASSRIAMADFATVKRIVGFDELEDFERNFPCT